MMENDNSELLQKYKDKVKVALLPIKLVGTFYDRIVFPEIPVNLKMLLTDIELPEKAKLGDGEGINGSLYNKPIKDILKRSADKGLTVFTKNSIPEIRLIQESNNILDQYKHLTLNSFIQSLLEGSDIDQPGIGTTVNIDVDHTGTEDQRKKQLKNTKLEPKKNIVDAASAIDDVVTSCLTGIMNLVRIIGGTDQEIKELTKKVSLMNDASYKLINEWMDSNNEVLKSTSIHAKEQLDLKLLNSEKMSAVINHLYAGQHNDYEIILPLDKDKSQKLHSIIAKFVDAKPNINSSHLINELLAAKLIRHKLLSQQTLNFIQESLQPLFEEETEKNESIKYDFDDIYRLYLNTIKTTILPILVSEPENWSIIKTARKQMEDLKKQTDEEITKKIEIICRTASGSTQDIGDKFKSALSKHPLRAEGLKNMWKRYSVELDQRIENRLKQLSDINGNGTAVNFARKFLTETYPNILATLLTYKTLLYTLQKEHKDYLSKSQLTDEEIEEQAQQLLDNDLQMLKADLWAINLEEQN